MAVPNTFATATSAIPLANLDANFAYYDGAFSISGTATTFAGSVTLTSGTANGVAYLNGSKVLTSGSALTFDGTQLAIGATSFDGNSRLTLWGTAGTDTGLTIQETSSGYNARLRISQSSGVVYYNATFSTSGNYHNFQIGNTTTATINSNGINVVPGSTAFLTGSLGSRLWTPGLAIGTGTYAGLYGPAITYLAEKSGSSWLSSGGGSAAAITIDEGYFSFSKSQNVGSSGSALTWTTYLESGASGDFTFNSTSFTRIARGTTSQRGTPSTGQLRWNTTFPQLEVCDGTTFQKIVTEPLITSATGGTITTDGDYKVHTFTSSGTFTVTTISGATKVLVQVMVLGGGGGGGFYLGGGGGGGAMLEDFVSMTATSYTVTVGAGGGVTTAGTGYSGNGGLSSITGSLFGITANGGGAGGNGLGGDTWGANGSANTNIGSGGGGGSPYGVSTNNGNVSISLGGPAGRNGSGGAFGTTYLGTLTFNGGGGGGGAQSAGVAPNIGNGPVGGGGLGGSAKLSYITGSGQYYGGGGGGGYGSYLANSTISGGSNAGAGVGTAATGSNLQATSGTANFGGGGGGGQATATYQTGGSGGSGVVIIRYKFQ